MWFRWFRRCSGNNEGSETHPGSGTGRQWSHSPAMWLTLFSSFLSPANQTLKCRFRSLKWPRHFTLFLPLLPPNKLSVVHSCILRGTRSGAGLVTKAWTLPAPMGMTLRNEGTQLLHVELSDKRPELTFSSMARGITPTTKCWVSRIFILLTHFLI